MRSMKKYTVIFLFNSKMNKVLMIHRKKQPYQGMYNGLGGKIEENEHEDQGAIRELREECGITMEDVNTFRKMLSSIYPSNIELHVYYGVLANNEKMELSQGDYDEEGVLLWMDVQPLLDVTRKDVAGEGNVAYYIHLAQVIEGVTS